MLKVSLLYIDINDIVYICIYKSEMFEKLEILIFLVSLKKNSIIFL